MVAARKSAAELDAEHLALLDEASELADLLDGPDARSLTKQEQARFDEITGEGGLASKKAQETADARSFEMARDRTRQDRIRLEHGMQGQMPVGVHKPGASYATPHEVNGATVDRRTAEMAGNFFRAVSRDERSPQAIERLQRMDPTRFGELATQVTTAPDRGGLTVPDPISAEIIRIRDRVSVLPPLARMFTVTADTLRVPKELTTPTVYYPGEATEIDASDATLGSHELQVVKRAALVRASSEVLADSVTEFGAWLVESMGFAMAHTMDNEALNGDGTAAFGGETGLINAIGAAGVNQPDGKTTLGDLELTDWTDTVSRLPGKFHNNAGWIMGRETWNNSVLPLMATAGGTGFAALMTGASGDRPTWLGYKVYFTDLMPAAAPGTTVAMFGDWRHALYLGERGDMRTDSTIYEKFSEDLTSYRMLHRYDWLVAEPGDADNVGAYVALKLAS